MYLNWPGAAFCRTDKVPALWGRPAFWTLRTWILRMASGAGDVDDALEQAKRGVGLKSSLAKGADRFFGAAEAEFRAQPAPSMYRRIML